MEDLCGTVCQHLTAYVKFVWVDDRISCIFLKRGSDLNDLAFPDAEKTVSEANNLFLLAFTGVPSLTPSTPYTGLSEKYWVNGKPLVFEKYSSLFLQFLKGRTVLKQYETTIKDAFPC